MAEKKKKPSSRDLAEIQSLFKELEADVGIGKVDEKLLQKFEQGELSKAEASKLQGELKDAMSRRPSPAVPKQFTYELPRSSGQYLSPETGFQLKTPIPEDKAVGFPKTLEPEVVNGRASPERKALTPGVMDAEVLDARPDYGAAQGQRMDVKPNLPVPVERPGALVKAERPGALAVIPGMPKATVEAVESTVTKNPVLKKLMLPVLAVAGVGAAVYNATGGKEPSAPPATPPTTPTPGPTPPPAPGPTPPAEPAAPKLMQAKSPDWDKFSKAYDGIAKRFAEDRKLSPEVEQAFSARQAELQSALSDAKGIYESAVSTTKSEADRREAITQWASIAESLGQSMVKYFAAREGARTGTLLGSKLQFQKYDWQKDLDRSLEKLKADTSEAKTRLGLAREDVEAQAKQLGEERKTADAEREDIARQRAKGAESLLSEQTRAEQRSAEQYASDYNRFLMEQAQEREREARATDKEQKAATKEESKVDLAKQKTFAQLAGAVASLEKKDTPQARKQIEETATLLGIPPDEVDELVKETTGEGMFQMAEPKKVQAILDKYRPGAASAAQPAGQAMVDMIAPDGRELSVPASRVAEMEAKGARRK